MALREINLVPADVVYRKYQIRHLFVWAGCLLFFLSLIFGFYLYQVYFVLPRNRPVATIKDIHTQLGATIEEISETQKEIERLRVQESFLKELIWNQSFSRVLLRLSEIMNNRTWLARLAIDAEKNRDRGEPGMSLSGYTLSNDDLGNFLTRLSVDSLFQGVLLKYAKESRITLSRENQKTPVRVIGFEIECRIPRP